MSTPELVEDLFRHEYGRLVATLCRRVGVEHLDAVEDAAQVALVRALEHWRIEGPPDVPSAWLFRVAHNHLVGELRKGAGRRRILARQLDALGDESVASTEPEPPLASELADDLARMLFVCCDDILPARSQLVLALKTLCGFSVAEIGRRLFITEANVYKRLTRARERLRETPPQLHGLPLGELRARVPAVLRVLYQLFTEGHLSSHAELAIREELCAEALRLGLILAEHPAGHAPEVSALVALMYLHSARLRGRADAEGALVLLEEQDRSQWDTAQIHTGLQWLERSAAGDSFSRYHAEAAIAAEHCLAPSFEQTRWDTIAELYATLERLQPSPLHRLSRAVATAEAQGPQAGLDLLEGFEPPTWLEGSHMWPAVLAELHRRCGHRAEAARYRELALNLAPTPAVRQLLIRRLSPGGD